MHTMSKKVAVVATSHSDLGTTGKKTGAWFEEVTASYYVFKDKGYDVVLASIQGGDFTFDAGSLQGDFVKPEDCQRALKDADFEKEKKASVPVGDLKAEDLDGIFMAGGHGCCWDFCGEPAKPLVTLIEKMWTQGKTVGAVCHGVVALFDAKDAQGSPLVKGKKVTGFSDTEEAAVGLTEVVPYLIEAKYKDLGAVYEKGGDWSATVVADGKLVTGQNPGSTRVSAEKMAEVMTA